MNLFLTLLIYLNAQLLIFAQTNVIDDARSSYLSAASNKSVCETMISRLNGQIHPTAIAYLGAYQALRAKYVISPFEKLSTFNRGKSNIEKAINMDSENPELRFLRLSVQINSPTFLNYKNEITQDKEMILKSYKSIQNLTLKTMIQQLFDHSDLLTTNEKSRLK